ncbi:MAG: molecular chaperone [Alkalinema sp. RL_2_19]|nr:molecular chaperone [Alkalinema sp. RL_2_19]
MEPISRVFTPTGANATQSYEIKNTTKELLAIEVSTAKRSMDLQGKETLTSADEDFMIYPPQILLKPGESQTVRVTWLGDPQPQHELAYRLIAEQLPIDLDQPAAKPTSKQGSAKVKLTMRYEGSLYIRPSLAAADVIVEQIATQQNGTEAMLAVTLHNRGTSRAILTNAQLQLTDGQQSHTLTATESSELIITVPYNECKINEIEYSLDEITMIKIHSYDIKGEW